MKIPHIRVTLCAKWTQFHPVEEEYDSMTVTSTLYGDSRYSEAPEIHSEEELFSDTAASVGQCDDCRLVAKWYIDHQRRQHCLQPRVVRVCSRQASWRDPMYTAWADVMRHNAPFRLTIAHPQPASFPYVHVRCRPDLFHVVVEQSLQFSAAAVLIAFPRTPRDTDQTQIRAFSTSTLTCGQLILRHSDLERSDLVCLWLVLAGALW